MNAVAPIAMQPILKPAYNNAALANFGNWYRTNEPALAQYFAALEGDGDFFDFCATQYDVELINNRQPLRYIERLSESECYGSDRR